MISSISSATPTFPATRAATSQTQPGNTSDPSHETEDAQRTGAGSDAEAKRDAGADTRELATTDREVRAHEAALQVHCPGDICGFSVKQAVLGEAH